MRMRNVEWVLRERSLLAGDVVVWIDVAQADARWRLCSHYIAPGASAKLGKYARFGRWFRRNDRPVEMAEVGLFEEVFSFINGRHRFAWMRDHGADALPIAADAESAASLAELIGAASKHCIIRDPWPN